MQNLFAQCWKYQQVCCNLIHQIPLVWLRKVPLTVLRSQVSTSKGKIQHSAAAGKVNQQPQMNSKKSLNLYGSSIEAARWHWASRKSFQY